MVTKFIGNADDLNYSPCIGLVNVSTILAESEIPNYTPLYFKQNNIPITLVYKTDGRFIYDAETNPIIFNAIIIYDAATTPIGFTVLVNQVDTSSVGIKNVEVLLNFAISGDHYIEIDIDDLSNYEQHIAQTPIAHKTLITSHRSAQYSDINNLTPNKSGFVNILDQKHTYRYSGSFMKGTSKYVTAPITITETDLSTDRPNTIYDQKIYGRAFNPNIIKVITIDNNEYLIYSIGNNQIAIRGFNDPTEIISNQSWVGQPIMLCPNLCLSIYNGVWYLYDTRKLLTQNNAILKIFTPSEMEEMRFTTDLLTGDLVFYIVNRDGVTLLHEKMIKVFNDINIYSALPRIEEILGFCDGLVVYKLSGDTDITRLKSNIPVMAENNSLSTSLGFTINESIGKIIALTNKLLIYESPGVGMNNNSVTTLKLLEIKPGDSSNAYYVTATYNLGYKNNWRKLDRISHNRVNPKDADIIMDSHKGMMFRLSHTSPQQIILL